MSDGFRRIHRRVDVSGEGDEQLSVAVTVCLPEGRHRGPLVFAFPGGGYARSYFDLDLPGYSMAEHFTAHGIAVVACDYLGAGESSRPLPYEALTLDRVAAANHTAVRALREFVETELDRGPPVPCIGLGHSLGAGLATVQQARYGDFDGLVLLGRPIGGTHIPAPPDAPGEPAQWREARGQLDEVEASSERIDGYYLQRRRTEWQRYLFYWEDVPETVIRHDEQATTTIPVNVAREIGGPAGPGALAAAAVDVPVLLGFGERDLSRAPHDEPRVYTASPDVQLVVLPASAHCHNFSTNRVQLWERICAWIYSAVDPPSMTSSLPVM